MRAKYWLVVTQVRLGGGFGGNMQVRMFGQGLFVVFIQCLMRGVCILYMHMDHICT
jgi:hypothetical protein